MFYNRYKNLDEFYDEFVKNYDYWLSDLVRDSMEEIGSEEGYSNILEKLLTNLMQEEIMTELLRWEIAEGNHITERTSRLRELHAIELINSYSELYHRENFDIPAITAILVAGIYYLVLHKDRSTFAGIDINTIPGKRRMLRAIRNISSLMFREEENLRLADASGDEDVETYRRNYEAACRERVESDFRDHVEDLMEARRIADRQRIAENMRAQGIPEDVIEQCVNGNHDE